MAADARQRRRITNGANRDDEQEIRTIGVGHGGRAASACASRAAARAPQTPPPAMPAPPDVKIETVNLAPGIYMLIGRGGNIGLTVGVDGAAIIDDQFADMAPKIRAAVAMLVGPAGEVRDQYAPARRSHRRQRCLRQGRRGDHRAGKRAQAPRHRAGESVHQRSPSRRARARRCRWSRSPTRRRCISTTTTSSSRTCRTRTPRPTSSIRFRKANIVHMGDCSSADSRSSTATPAARSTA